jgi:outer membrane protein assembly factor BamB
VDDLLFSVSDAGVATCFDAKSGKIHWTHRLSGAFSASPTVAGGRIYFQNETGETTIVKAASEYEEIAVNQISTEPTRTFASFAVIDQSILLRSEKHLYRIQN